MASSRKLVTYVYVDGQPYGPDDDVPADVAKQITNPKAWGEEPDTDEGGSESAKPAKKAAAKKASSSTAKK